MGFPNAPQAFSFQNRSLQGLFISFNGQNPRRAAVHQFGKRKGARVEDMERGPRRLETILEFVGDDCAKQYQDFKAAVDENPFGLLVHPIAGKYFAFCEGPQENVDFGRSTTEIRVTVAFVESELDNQVAKDPPDVATAAQNVTAKNDASQRGTSAFMAGIAKAQLFEARAVAAVDKVLDQVATAEAPLDFVISSVSVIGGVTSAVIGAIDEIAVKGEVLAQQVTTFVDSTTDLFDGGDVTAGVADATTTLLGVVETTAEELADLLITASTTPAGAAEACGVLDELVAACLVLQDAVQAARPPTVLVTLAALTDLITFCQERYPGKALQRAIDIMQMNRIPNPAAMPAGFVFRAPTK